MAKIKILDSLLASKIAAGEVVERPASVVKELMENSIDAGSASISVHILEGGKRLIKITDDGDGMSREDAALAFERHATSKISDEADLEAIRTMGFRGEALSSIAAVARVNMKTRRHEDITGASVTIEGSTTPEVSEDGCPEGTTIEVKDIFFNTPARLKFLRSNESEFGKIAEVFKKIALINPDKRFKLVHGSTKVIDAQPGTLKQRIADIFGPDVSKNLIEVHTPDIKGFIGTHELAYQTSKNIFVYVNGRPVRDKSMNRAIIEGYGQIIDAQRYPLAVLDLAIPFEDVDINIHPAKSEVRFKNQKFIFDIFKSAVKISLSKAAATRPDMKAEAPPSFSSMPQTFQSFAAESAMRYSGEAAPGLFEDKNGDTDVKNPEFLLMEPVGQLWGEFLVAESRENGGEFFLIDQHGAAERAAFERLKKALQDGAVKSQMLLLPERVETTPDESEEVKASIADFKKLGFEVIEFGPGRFGGQTFLVKAAPDLLASRSSAALIKDIAEELTTGGSSKAEEKIESVLMRIACHSVIRGPKTLSREEGRALLRAMADIDFAGYCPHGRPVIKKFSRGEVETFFKR